MKDSSDYLLENANVNRTAQRRAQTPDRISEIYEACHKYFGSPLALATLKVKTCVTGVESAAGQR